MENLIKIGNRVIDKNNRPLIIAEIGINHEGDFNKAKKMIKDAYNSNAECVKFQCHIIEDEMIPNNVVPGNATESIWEIMKRCSLTFDEEKKLKKYTEDFGMIYLNTPFSRESANRLEEMDISAYKIGSGECNNIPLIKHIVSFGKPIILSTGMNDITTISKSVEIIKNANLDYALLHVTSMYPTPYDKVRLGAMKDIQNNFTDAVIGLSDHSIGNYTCFAAVSLGASILEKHFTSDKNWPGPDIPISLNPSELKDLIIGSNAIFQAMGGTKNILPEEEPTINFAYSSVVSIKDIKKGEKFTKENIWIKRPGTGEIRSEYFEKLLNSFSKIDIMKDKQLKWDMIED
jgi:sialic acid synthase SpsE